jgi:beta-galactosidase
VGSYDNFFEDVISINDYTITGPDLPQDKPHLLSETVGVNYQSRRGGKPKRVRNYVEWHLFITNRVYGDPTCAGNAFWEIHDTNTFLEYSFMGMPSFLTNLVLDPFHHLWHWGVTDAWHIPKEPFYAYRSQLVEEPFIHVSGSWDRRALRDVMVLHNCDQVELALNGRSLGRRGPDKTLRPNNWIRGESFVTSVVFGRYGVKRAPREVPYHLPHPPTTFENVTYELGELVGRCIMDDEAVAEHRLRTPGKADRITLEPDYATICADGSDMTRVVVRLVDEQGTLINDGELEFDVHASGPARVLADRNPRLEAGMAAFYVQSDSFSTGTVTVEVGSQALAVSESLDLVVAEPGPEKCGF